MHYKVIKEYPPFRVGDILHLQKDGEYSIKAEYISIDPFICTTYFDYFEEIPRSISDTEIVNWIADNYTADIREFVKSKILKLK